jgi:hypothetical protein
MALALLLLFLFQLFFLLGDHGHDCGHGHGHDCGHGLVFDVLLIFFQPLLCLFLFY